jgi:hypothetical protein
MQCDLLKPLVCLHVQLKGGAVLGAATATAVELASCLARPADNAGEKGALGHVLFEYVLCESHHRQVVSAGAFWGRGETGEHSQVCALHHAHGPVVSKLALEGRVTKPPGEEQTADGPHVSSYKR